MHRIAILAASILLLAAAFVSDNKPVTVFFVRHAETETSTRSGGDPALSEAGLERARSLARLLSKAGVTHLFSSQVQRTQQTLEPLAAALEIKVELISAKQEEQQVRALKTLPAGSVAVVAGHSNTVPKLVGALGGEVLELVEHERYGKIFDHDSYDRLILVTLPLGEADTQTIELRYGEG